MRRPGSERSIDERRCPSIKSEVKTSFAFGELHGQFSQSGRNMSRKSTGKNLLIGPDMGRVNLPAVYLIFRREKG